MDGHTVSLNSGWLLRNLTPWSHAIERVALVAVLHLPAALSPTLLMGYAHPLTATCGAWFAVLCLLIYLNRFRASQGCRRQRLLARRSRQFRRSYVLVFIWLLSTRSEICVVLDSACPNSKYRAKRERRRVIAKLRGFYRRIQ